MSTQVKITLGVLVLAVAIAGATFVLRQRHHEDESPKGTSRSAAHDSTKIGPESNPRSEKTQGHDPAEDDEREANAKMERYDRERSASQGNDLSGNWRGKYRPQLHYAAALDRAVSKALDGCDNLDKMIEAYLGLLRDPTLEPYRGELYVRLVHLYGSQEAWEQCDSFARMAMQRTTETTYIPDLEYGLKSPQKPSEVLDRSGEPVCAATIDAQGHKLKYPDLVSEYALWRLAQCYQGADNAKYVAAMDELWRRQREWKEYQEADTKYLTERLERERWTVLDDQTYYIRIADKAVCELASYYVVTQQPGKAIPYQEELLKKYSGLGHENIGLMAELSESYLATGSKDEARQMAQRALEQVKQLPALTMFGTEGRKSQLNDRLQAIITQCSQ